MKNKVCMLTTGHSALDDRIFYKEARSLYQAGFEVFLIAPLNKDGFLTDMGYNSIVRGESTIDGIKVIGFSKKSSTAISNARKIDRCLRLSSIGRLGFGQDDLFDIIEKGKQLGADIYHCHEVESLYAGIQIKQKLKKKGQNPKLICDVHEFWTAKNSKKLSSMVWSNIVSQFETRAFKYVDYVITVNHIIRGHLLSFNHYIKADVLYNCPVLSIFQEYDREANDETITICHEGSLPFNRGLKEMLEVMKILKARYNGKIRFLIVGDIFGEARNYFEQKTKEYQIEDIAKCTGWLPYEKVGTALSSCSVGIIFMELTRENNMLAGPPNKLFNYMRYGIPVVTVDLPETRRIVLESQCGIVVKERTVDVFVEALSLLIDNKELRYKLGVNGRKAVYEKYSWEIMEKKLLRIYNELLSTSKYIVPIQ